MNDRPRIFTEEYYETLLRTEEEHWWCRGMRTIAEAMLKPMLDSERGITALDAGCGTGGGLAWLKRLAGDGQFVGCDLSLDSLKLCGRHGQRDLACASVLDLPYRSESFDVVISMDVLQHLPVPGGDIQALRECYRVLRPGGLVLVRSNARRWGDTSHSAEADYKRYTTRELGSCLEEAGLRVERLTYVNTLDARLERLRSIGRKPKRQAQQDTGLPLRLLPATLWWVDGIRYAMLAREARTLRTPGSSLKLGHSTVAIARRPS